MTDHDNLTARIQKCEAILGYTFTNKLLCIEALQRRDRRGYEVIWDGQPQTLPNNQRLAIVGDAVLSFLLVGPWYSAETTPEDWDQLCKRVVSNKALGDRGKALGLDQCTITNPGTKELEWKAMATTVEALIGAVQTDAGMAEVERMARRLGVLGS